MFEPGSGLRRLEYNYYRGARQQDWWISSNSGTLVPLLGSGSYSCSQMYGMEGTHFVSLCRYEHWTAMVTWSPWRNIMVWGAFLPPSPSYLYLKFRCGWKRIWGFYVCVKCSAIVPMQATGRSNYDHRSLNCFLIRGGGETLDWKQRVRMDDDNTFLMWWVICDHKAVVFWK